MSDTEPENKPFKEKVRHFSFSAGDKPKPRRGRPKKMTELDQAKIEKVTAHDLLKESFTELEVELKKEPVDKKQIGFLHRCLTAQLEEFKTIHQKYQDLLLKADNQSVFTLEKKLEKNILRKKIELDIACKQHRATGGGGGGGNGDTHRLKLPKWELPKYDGEPRKWLSFWASFKDIHDDDIMPEMEKFKYLIQAVVPGTPAEDVVTSFPHLPKNYEKVIERLHERFGRPKMLVKIYVRDLLELVMENARGKGMEFVSLVTKLNAQIRNLESLGVTTDQCEDILYPIVESCLPEHVHEAWQNHPNHSEELAKLMEYLDNAVNNKNDRTMAQAFGSKLKTPKEEKAKTNTNTKTKSTTPTASTLMVGETKSSKQQKGCVFCDRNHLSELCNTAISMGPEERNDIVLKKGHCLACLKKGHVVRECKGRNVKCIVCGEAHHTVMCIVFRTLYPNFYKRTTKKSTTAAAPPAAAEKNNEVVVPPEFQAAASSGPSIVHSIVNYVTPVTSPDAPIVHSLANQVRSPDVPLQIVVVTAYGTNGKKRRARVAIDTGSMRSYAVSSLAQELELPSQGEERVISNLFGGAQTRELKMPIKKLMISNLNGSNLTMFNVSVIDVIVRDTPATQEGCWTTDFLRQGIQFSDVNSDSEQIDILIGNDIAAKIYTGRICHLPYGPSAMETKFGWALCGKLPMKKTTAGALLISTLVAPDRPLSELWELESIGIMDSAAKVSRQQLEEDAMKHFNATVRINEEGRYEVELPFLSGTSEKLTSNFPAAERRLRYTTKDVQKKNALEAYDKVLQQWETDSMIEEVDDDDAFTQVHYLPHTAVIKPTSTTTPIRPVFDASAKPKGGYSLNDCQEKGPNLLQLIPAILIRFMLFPETAVADIKKAFQQISVNPKHRDFLRFLWWVNKICKKLKRYRHKRVVFGVSSSPFLLGAVLQHLLKKAKASHKDTALLLMASMYVDNLVASFRTKAAAKHFQRQSQELLMPAHFDLRGWEFGPSPDEKVIPVLGLLYKSKADTLQIDISSVVKKLDEKCTKKNVLSLCHMLYDPLGFIAPFALIGKVILRQCHTMKLAWDTEMPPELANEFTNWKKQIVELGEVQIPRHVFFGEQQKSLHLFCDASRMGLAAAVFLRAETEAGVEVHLLFCKSRLTPLKKKETAEEISIPRLELIAAEIGARLLNTVQQALPEKDIPYFAWSDSSTALAWILGEGPWGVFVENRAKSIRSLTQTNRWFHIPGENNPADLPSRGASVRKLIATEFWKGPEWLRLPTSEWPKSKVSYNQEEIDKERKKVIIGLLAKEENTFINELTRYSSYFKIVRIMSLVYRFIRKLKRARAKRQGLAMAEVPYFPPRLIPTEEYYQTEESLLLLVQQQFEGHEKSLKKLNPIKDPGNGLLRIKTRLFHEDTTDFLTPIALPGDDQLVKLLILEEHEQNSHAGVQFTLASLRNRYWITNGRRVVRQVINACATCRRFTAQPLTVPEAPLPKLRTGELVPFSTTGVDMAGPLYLKDGSKVWIALFSCATYRAIHLEITPTLSAEGFINCLRRFVGRRGRPSNIYSDNGLNFTGTSRILKNIDWTKVERYASTRQINWMFNPPASPWWGGWYERMVSLVKQLLRRNLGNRVVDLEELTTISIELEEVINNRPLTTLTEDPEDLVALTPNHFARNSILAYLPELDVRTGRGLKGAYKKLQRLRQALRSRFRLEYLGFLRHQFVSKPDNHLKPGDVVLIENELTKRLDWPIAIVKEVIYGRDKKIRSYRLRTKNGDLVRAAQRILPLEIISE